MLENQLADAGDTKAAESKSADRRMRVFMANSIRRAILAGAHRFGPYHKTRARTAPPAFNFKRGSLCSKRAGQRNTFGNKLLKKRDCAGAATCSTPTMPAHVRWYSRA